ncbi:MAG: bifunctional MaoC family dehydratase N-terminal/OB-fold nucleic acid binding domain-containing protein [Acidimicrobiales bacterium]
MNAPATAEAASFQERLSSFEGRPVGPPTPGLDEVNRPMIRHYAEAVGDTNPVYVDEEAARRSVHGGLVAPPGMLQAWSMRGLRPRVADGDPSVGTATVHDELMALLDGAGFTSVVATNCEQQHLRYLRPGDSITVSTVIESVSTEKRTALGVGHFVTTISSYGDQRGDPVATMRFRILKFRPTARTPTTPTTPTNAATRPEPTDAVPAVEPSRPLRPRPALTPDNEFWFEGARQHQLLIQRCASCGVMRHPPRPMCDRCRSLEWEAFPASGRATLHSFVVNHHPKVPAFDYPLVVGLVDLEEGTRLVSDLVGVEPSAVRIGMPLLLDFMAFDDELVLPVFRPAGS